MLEQTHYDRSIGRGVVVAQAAQERDQVVDLEQRLLDTERAYSLSVVASGLADELRNPVGWIRNNLTVIETSVAAATA